MERIDISDERPIADLVEAVERGEEVVIMRGEAVVARLASEPRSDAPRRVFDMSALEDLHRRFPIRFGGAGALIREMRDMDDH